MTIPNLTPASPIRKAIYDWAALELDMPFIWAEQDVHRPNKPYGTLKIIPGFIKVGSTDNIRHKTGDIFTIVGVREFAVSLQCFGDNALGRAGFVASSIEKPSVIEKFQAAGLVVVSVDQVNDLTRLVDNQWESRGQVGIRFRLTHETDDTVGFIESVEIKNNIDGTTTIVEQ